MGRSARYTLIGLLAVAVLGGVPRVLAAGGPLPQTKPQPKTQAKAPAKPPATAEVPEETRDVNLRAYVELLRSDVRAQKTAIMAGVLQLSEADDAKFWPIYREYEAELAKVNDDRIANIKDYAEHFDQLTDDVADKLIQRALEIQGRRSALLLNYYNKLKGALSAKTAARVVQIENQILLILDLQIAASLPIVKADSR